MECNVALDMGECNCASRVSLGNGRCVAFILSPKKSSIHKCQMKNTSIAIHSLFCHPFQYLRKMGHPPLNVWHSMATENRVDEDEEARGSKYISWHLLQIVFTSLQSVMNELQLLLWMYVTLCLNFKECLKNGRSSNCELGQVKFPIFFNTAP